MNAQAFPNVVLKPAGVAEWHNCGTRLVIDGKIWPPEDWRELAALWSAGVKAAAVETLFRERGYSEREIDTMRAHLAGSPFILPPIERALFVLAGAARRDTCAGGFRIVQTPARAADVIKAANRVLATLALPQIRYPSAGEA